MEDDDSLRSETDVYGTSDGVDVKCAHAAKKTERMSPSEQKNRRLHKVQMGK